MAQSEQPLYPKLSSIYNKIMQLAIAIALIIVLLNVLLFNHQQNSENIEQHFKRVGNEYSSQAATALTVLFAKNDKQGIQDYIDQLSSSDAINSVHFYDHSGQLIFHSQSAKSIRALFGIEARQMNNSGQFIPFVKEIRAQGVNVNELSEQALQGYLRLTIAKSYLVDNLNASNDKAGELFRIMLVLAGVVGFLLTRGLNRFSRQGFRLGDKS